MRVILVHLQLKYHIPAGFPNMQTLFSHAILIIITVSTPRSILRIGIAEVDIVPPMGSELLLVLRSVQGVTLSHWELPVGEQR